MRTVLIYFLFVASLLNASLNKPSDLKLSPSIHSVSINWKDNADDESGYKVFRGNSLVAVLQKNSKSYIDKGLSANTTYRYTVKATNEKIDAPISVLVKQNQDNLIFSINGLFEKSSHSSIFIDSDQNTKSGYSKYSVKGADYLIQDKNIYSYVGPHWKWKEIYNKVSVKYSPKVITYTIPKSVINFSDKLNFVARISTKNWNKNTDLVSSFSTSNDLLDYHLTKEGVVLDGFMVKDQNLLAENSKIFDLKILNLSDNKIYSIDSQSNWNSVVKDGKNIIFSSPRDSNLPKTLKVIATIKQNDKQVSFDVEIDGVGENHSLVNVEIPKLNIKKLPSGNFLIPKYTGKVVKTDEVAIKRDMLYPCGWCSTMQFLAYYNENLGLYIGNHDPKSSRKRFIINDNANTITYITNITVPNKGLSSNNFKLSGEFVLAPLEGDWYDAALKYKSWASKNALYWPKMDEEREKSQHNIGDIALWVTSTYISAITNSNRTQESKDEHIKNYLTGVEKDEIIDTVATQYPGIKIGIFWHEWYGKLHDTYFPSVFFPDSSKLTKIKAMMDDVKTKYPNIVFMPYINGLLYNTSLPEFNQEFIKYALKDAAGNVVPYYPHSKNADQNRPEYLYARMDPTTTPWQNKIKDAADIVLNRLDASGINIDQVTASRPIEDMDRSHNHPIAGGSWWRDGYDKMLSKIENSIDDKKFITSEGANEFLSNRIDGFFVHWDGVNNMVPAYQVVYGGKVQLFGLEMRTKTYKKDIYYMLRGQAFVNGFGIGMITPWLSHDDRPAARVAFNYIKDISWMKYNLREFLSYGTRQKDLKLNGNIGVVSDTTEDPGNRNEEDNNNGLVTITMPLIQHSVYRSEDGKKIAFIFTNVSRNDSANFSFDINGARYGLNGNLRLTELRPNQIGTPKAISNHTTQKVTLQPLGSIAFIIEK